MHILQKLPSTDLLTISVNNVCNVFHTKYARPKPSKEVLNWRAEPEKQTS